MYLLVAWEDFCDKEDPPNSSIRKKEKLLCPLLRDEKKTPKEKMDWGEMPQDKGMV